MGKLEQAFLRVFGGTKDLDEVGSCETPMWLGRVAFSVFRGTVKGEQRVVLKTSTSGGLSKEVQYYTLEPACAAQLAGLLSEALDGRPGGGLD